MKYVLVTVGTTQFVQLVKVFENDAVINQLHQLGYEKLVVQFGSGTVSYAIFSGNPK
jgi:UDP-N-acetylglucosamine transferase subunit ALG13